MTINAGSFTILAGGAFSGFAQFFLKVDWNRNGIFDSSEETSSDAIALLWNRGRESEESNTPAGTLSVSYSDPLGNYVPGSTQSKWGSSNVTTDREVSLRAVYKDTTYPCFRGRISRITPRVSGGRQTADIFAVDGFDELEAKTISIPVGTESTSNVTIGTGNGGALFGGRIGNTTGYIANVLDESSWGSTRRQLGTSTGGFAWFWAYDKPARTVLHDIEKASRGTIFINGSGDVVYHTADQREGSTFLASFTSDRFQEWDYSFSGRSIRNVAEITATQRSGEQTSGDGFPGGSSNGLVNIANNSTWTRLFKLPDPLPIQSVVVPLPGVDVKFTGTPSGTTYTSTAGISVFGSLIGGEALRLRIVNNTTEAVRQDAPDGAASTNVTYLFDRNNLVANDLVSSRTDSDSIARHGRRVFQLTNQYGYRTSTEIETVAQDIIDRRAGDRPDFTRFSLMGSDSDAITQILARELNDKIRVTSTELKINAQDYHINAAEWSKQPGEPVTVRWSLEQST